VSDAALPVVSVVIVTYNSAQVIAECLDSLTGPLTADGTPAFTHEIIVVDNQSTDDTVVLVRARFPHVRVILNPENAGFSRAVNLAAGEARGRTLLLLNPDAMIEPQVVDGLAARLLGDPSIGVISPVLENEGEEVRIIAAGHAPTIWRMFLHQTGLSRLGGRFPALEGHYLFASNFAGRPRDVDWTSGGCLMARTDLWRELAGLTDRWFMYAEDVEFCLRVRSSGARVVVDPTLHATHAMGGSSSNVDGRVNTAWIVNLFDLYGWRMARTGAQTALWRKVVEVGMLTRVGYFRLSGLRSGRRASAAQQVARFRIYRRALAEATPARVHEPLRPDWVARRRPPR
jgi:N-acetylglucosaminyl-diphospho-decaprenol L-rhamnosyltransferase